MDRKWLRLLLPMAMMLLLSGCLFRPPDDLYRLPEMTAGYDQLTAAIKSVRAGLEMEYGVGSETAVIVSGDNTATTQLQDLDGDGKRESAVVFLRIPGVEKSLKIYIFKQIDGIYQMAGVVEGDGSAVYSVDYVDLNGSGSKELVVNWQISTGVYQLGAYTLDELRPLSSQNNGAGASNVFLSTVDRTSLLATELLLTGCSGASESSDSYSSGYRLLDIDQDTRTEIAVVRMDSASVGSKVEVYGWQDGAFVSLSSANLSTGAVTLNQIRSNYLSGEYYPPALYVTCTLEDGTRAIDVLAYQEVKGQEQKQLVNLSLDPETGVSRSRLQGYTEVGLTDINGDYVLEIPSPKLLPTPLLTAASNFWLIDWGQYDEAGEKHQVMTTYHNVTDGWYLVVPERWKNKITISRNDQILLGQREVVFSLWDGGEEPPQPFLSIYRLTGSNRAAQAAYSGRFILREEESVIYAARFYDTGWDCGLDSAGLMENFKTIQTTWYS